MQDDDDTATTMMAVAAVNNLRTGTIPPSPALPEICDIKAILGQIGQTGVSITVVVDQDLVIP